MIKKLPLFLFLAILLVIDSCSKDNPDPQVTQISLSQNAVQLQLGDTLTLKMTYTPANLPAPSCQWSNSNPSVATLDSHNKLTAISRGETTITIMTNNGTLMATCKVTVTYKGDGSVNNPYCIYTVDDLKNFRDSINKNHAAYGDKAYKLMADLDFSKESPTWISIGNSPEVAFRGCFDGNNKSIDNIAIGILNSNGSGRYEQRVYAGLFGCIEDARISNLTIKWTTIRVSTTTHFYAGGIVGYGSGTISNCQVSGMLCGDIDNMNEPSYIGGIIGYGKATTTLLNCHVNSGCIMPDNSLDRIAYAGGIAGYVAGNIANCYSLIPVKRGYQYVGGIVGYAIGTIQNCYSTGSVSCILLLDNSLSISSGGIVGGHIGTIINCYATGMIYGTYSGGIAGDGGNIFNCYSSGDIYAFDKGSQIPGNAGGIAAQASSIANCLALCNNVVGAHSCPNASRVCGLLFSSVSSARNYANPSMTVKIKDAIPVTDFSDTRLNGYNLTAQPVDLLNSYVAANPTFNGITLSKWKVTSGVNNGYPVFE